MGKVIDGQWVDDDVVATDAAGQWTRTETRCRDWVRADGSTPYAPEPGRYHLWLAWNCTWSHRCMIVRQLLGLEEVLSISLAHWHRNAGGWWFREGVDDLQPDEEQAWEDWSSQEGFVRAEPDRGLSLWKVYVAGDAHYTGRATVPVLWDRKLHRVVSNESREILRMVETEFASFVKRDAPDLLPDELREAIDTTNEWVYRDINNRVYQVGFAGSQAAYAESLEQLFAALDRVESILSGQPYLCGTQLTEADLRLFPTLVRFDPVYFGHFKCNRRRIADYPAISAYLKGLMQIPAFADSVRVLYYKLGYMGRSERLNPSRIIPEGPELDWLPPR